MAFRFRKIFKITPGVKVNLSKSGLSTSLGRKGATVNLSRKGVRQTLGIPGTGLGYQTDKKTPVWVMILIFLVICAILVLNMA